MGKTIKPGDTLFVHPSSKPVIVLDWDSGRNALEAGVEISSYTIEIDVIKQNSAAATLDYDSDTLQTGNRTIRVRFLGTEASEGDLYTLTNTIVTNETPAQTLALTSPIFVTTQVIR